MCAQNPVDGTPAHEICKMFFPNLFTVLIADTRIDNHPAIFVLKRPEIDMVKPLHRERKAQPVNALGDFYRATGFRCFIDDELQQARGIILRCGQAFIRGSSGFCGHPPNMRD